MLALNVGVSVALQDILTRKGSITRPEAGLSVKCPLMSEGSSVCRLTRSTIHANASVQKPRFQ